MLIGTGVYHVSAEIKMGPNQALLEAMLNGDRKWVIETLVNDNRSNNPMAILQNNTEKSMAQDALDTYNGVDANGEDNLTAYKMLVNVLVFKDNATQYVAGLLDWFAAGIAWIVSLFSSSDEIEDTAGRLVASRQELQYNMLLKSVFTESYTASDGTTLQNADGSLLMVRQVKNALDYFGAFTSYMKNSVSTVVGTEEYDVLEAEYITNYAIPYSNAANGLLSRLGSASAHDNELAVMLAADLATVARLSMVQPKASYTGLSYSEVLYEMLVESDVKQLIGDVGNMVSKTGTALDTYLYVNSIKNQRDEIDGMLSRLSTVADSNGNSDMADSVENFRYLMSDEYNNQILSWDSIGNYLRSNRVVSNYLAKNLINHAKKLLHLTDDYLLGAVAAKATSVVGISTWASDQLIGIESIAKKTYELLYWEDFAKMCVKLYKADLAAYQAAPGEDTAAAVLEDLQLLQKVRLYGEKVALDLNCAPNDSIIGQLYGGELADEGCRGNYQKSVDALIAASVVPSMTGITVASGEKLFINYSSDVGFYGYNTSSGAYYVELPTRLAGGITVNGTLVVNAEGHALKLGVLDLGGGATFGSYSSDIAVTELYQSGSNAKIILKNAAILTVTERMRVQNLTFERDNTSPMLTKHLEISGTVAADVVATGNVTGSSGSLSGLTMNGSMQTINGTLSVGNLSLGGDQVTVSGTVNVSQSLRGPAVTVIGGKNIVFSGNSILSGRWNGDLSVHGAALSDARICGVLHDKGGSTYTGNVIVEQGWECSTVSTVAADSVLTVYGDIWLNADINGNGVIVSHGDFGTDDRVVVSNEIRFDGAERQNIYGNFSANAIRFLNTGDDVTVHGTVTVTALLEDSAKSVKTIKPLHLSDFAVLTSGFSGSISVGSCSLPVDTTINGDLIVRDGATLSGVNAQVAGTLTVSGSAVIDGITVNTSRLTSSSALTLLGGASVEVRDIAELAGTLSGEEELLIHGDASISGLTGGKLRVRGDVITSGTTTLDALTLDGSARQEIAGSGFTVGDLNICNTSGRPLKLAQTITVTGRYDNSGVIVEGGAIQCAVAEYTQDTVLRGDVKLDAPLTVTGCTLTIDGALSAPGITLVNATLIVNGDVTLTGGTLSVDADSALAVNGYLEASSGAFTSAGTMEIRADLSLGSASLTCAELILGGDLYGSGAVTATELTLNGRIRQRICSVVHAGNVTMDNSSNGGILLQSTLYYSGVLETNQTALFNESNLVKEDA